MITITVKEEANENEGYPEVSGTVVCSEDMSAIDCLEAFRRAMLLSGYIDSSIINACDELFQEYKDIVKCE